MAQKSYLDEDGTLYLWNKIKAKFATIASIPAASSTTPSANGTASAGSENTWSRGDHVHPTDTTRAPLASPALTGTPTAPTPTSGDDSTKIATTAFVQDAISGITPGTTYTFAEGSTDGAFSVTPAGGSAQSVPIHGVVTSEATQSAKGYMSSTDKTKLDGFQAASNYALKSELTDVYHYKGSVATESLLPSTGQSVGDVYDIVAESTYGPAGQNVAWTGTGWDPLGGIFTISSITNAWIDANCT